MTERLTEINEFGNADIIGVDTFKLFGNLKPTEFLQASNALDKLAHYEDLEEQGYRMVNINKIIEQLEELEKEYPYRVVGEPETYSQYNEGWSDCIDRAIGIVKGSE